MKTIAVIGFNAFTRTLLLLSIVLAVSCTEAKKDKFPEHKADERSTADSVVDLNRRVVESEIQEIDDYIRRYQWEMMKTQTGLRYMIYQKGSGPVVSQGSIVSIKYRVNLLNGDLVFRTDPAKLFSFQTGKRDVVSGLEEGVMLMKKGDHAKLIVPSHLAFGLLGDLGKVPSRAVLVYDVELCEINQVKK